MILTLHYLGKKKYFLKNFNTKLLDLELFLIVVRYQIICRFNVICEIPLNANNVKQNSTLLKNIE